MGRYGASFLVVLCVGLVSAVGVVSAAAQVEVSAVSDPSTAAPGDFITTVFEVRNEGGSPETFDLELDLPSGLTPLAPPRSVTLEPGESERLFISIGVTRQAGAGRNDVTLTATARSDPSVRDAATIVVEIEASASLAIRPPDNRQVLPGETITFGFAVRNRGNVIDRAVLEARSLRNFPIEASPPSRELLPGESVDIGVRVTVPEGAEPGRDRITLTARSARFETETSATIDLTVLPPSPREVSQDLSLIVPSVLRIGETTTGADPIDVTTSISGTAPFGEASRLDYRLDVDNVLDLRTVRVRLERPSYALALGDVAIPLTELIEVEGRGVGATLGATPDDASGATLAVARATDTETTDAEALNIGARAALQGGDWVAALAGRRGADTGETVAGVSLLRRPLETPALQVSGALSRHPTEGTDSAFRVRGRTTLAPFVFDGAFLRAGPAFQGTISDELSVSLEPGVAFNDAEIHTRVAWTRDGLGADPAQTGTAETQFGADARVDLAPLPIVIAQADYETEVSAEAPIQVDRSVFTVQARTSKTWGPLTLGAHVLREVSHDRLAAETIVRSQWRTEAELRLASALLSARLGLTTDVDRGSAAVDDRFLTALLDAGWTFDAFGIGFSMERDRGATRFAADVDGAFGRWTWASSGSITLDDEDELPQFNLSIAAGLDFEVPVSFIKVNGQVEGRVFVDANGNGVYDDGEAGVDGLSLRLGGAQARTDETGLYRFPPMAPGAYSLTIDALPATLRSEATLPRRVAFEAGRTVRVDLPVTRVASIRALVFDDADENGRRSAGEAGLGNVRVIAVGPDGRDRRTRTDADGRAAFGGLAPGRWRVSLDTSTLPAAYQLTTPGQVAVEATSGEQVDVAFGAVEREPEIRFSPTADFSISPTEPRVGETVVLDGSASFDPDGSIASHEWDLDGDGTVDATGQQVRHVYESAGTVDVTLTVTDDDGLTGSLSRRIEVSER